MHTARAAIAAVVVVGAIGWERHGTSRALTIECTIDGRYTVVGYTRCAFHPEELAGHLANAGHLLDAATNNWPRMRRAQTYNVTPLESYIYALHACFGNIVMTSGHHTPVKHANNQCLDAPDSRFMH